MGPRRIAALVALGAVALGLSAPAAAQAARGRGSGESSVTGAQLDVASGDDRYLVKLALLDSAVTLDKARRGVPRNHATGTVSAAEVDLGPAGAVRVPREPLQVSRDETSTGADRDSQNLTVAFNVPGDLPASEVGVSNPTVAGLLTDIEGARSSTVPDGLVAKGDVRPLNLEAVFNVGGATSALGATIESAEAAGGLARVSGFDVTDQEAASTADLVRASVRDLTVDSITALDMSSLLGLLGFDQGELPVGVLAKMADALGLPASGTLGSTPVSDFGSWSAARTTLADSKSQLEGQLTGTCTALPGTLTGLLGSAGVSCSGTVQEALDAVNGLLDQLLDLVQNAVYGASFVSVDELESSVQAVATVTPDGRAETSAAATGSIGEVLVGGTGCGSVTADLTTSTLSQLQAAWNTVRSACNGQIDEVLGALGAPYQGLVDVVPVSAAVQTTKVEKHEGAADDYAVADARLSLLQVKVTLPVSLPDPPELPIDGTGTTTTTTTLPVTTTTVTVPSLPVTTTSITLPDGGLIASVHPASETLGTLVTVEVGVLSAHAEFTRPGVEITSGGDNRTWNSRSGFGGPLPRTGGGSGTAPLAIFAVLAVTAYGLNRLAGSKVRRLTR